MAPVQACIAEMFTPNCLRAIIDYTHDFLREKEIHSNELFAAHFCASFIGLGPVVDGTAPICPRHGGTHGQTNGPAGSLGTSVQRTLCGCCSGGRVRSTDNLRWGA